MSIAEKDLATRLTQYLENEQEADDEREAIQEEAVGNGVVPQSLPPQAQANDDYFRRSKGGVEGDGRFPETREQRTQPPMSTPTRAPQPLRASRTDDYRLGTVPASQIEAKPIVPLLPGMLYAGKVTVIAGLPGDAKSLLSTDIAARLSTGSAWPVGAGKFALAHPRNAETGKCARLHETDGLCRSQS